MAVLVTGGGLLGSLIAAKLIEQGEKPVIYDSAPPMEHLATVLDLNRVKVIRADILDLPDLIDAIKKENIDCVIHTAGLLLAGVMARPYAGVNINIMGTLNVLEAVKILGTRRVVFCSTGVVQASVLGVPAETPYEEDFNMKCLSQRPRPIYAITKLAAEYLGLSYHELYGVDFVALRLGTFFGPWKGVTSGVPGRFIDQFVKKAIVGKPVVVDDPFLTYSGGVDFVYAKDCANATILACSVDKSKLESRVYNISCGRTYTLQEVVDIVKKVFPQVEIRIKEISKGGIAGLPFPTYQPFDISRARNELGYKPQYDLEEAIRDYADWLRRHYV